MFAMCYDCAKMSVYVGRYLFRDEVCSFLKKWLCTSSASAILYVNGYNQMLLKDKVGQVGITMFFGWSNGYDHTSAIVYVCKIVLRI